MAALGTLPVDALQALFALPDPAAIAAKYRAFGRMDQDGEAARDFVALEDWLNDGVPLGGPDGARDAGRLVRRQRARARRLAGAAAASWTLPRWPCPPSSPSPQRDRIVPPATASGAGPADPGRGAA